MFKVIIDAGHGGKDIGVKGMSNLEKDLNLFEARELSSELEKLGVETVLTRDKDEYININSRNIEEEADILISFHKNGNSHKYSKGGEVIYSKERSDDLKHAITFSEIISKTLNSNDLGGKIKLNSNNEDYHKITKIGLEKNINHIFLVNTGYLSSSSDEIKLMDKELVKKYIRKMAEYIFFKILNDATKIRFELNNENLDINNIVRGESVFVDINQLKNKIDIPIRCFSDSKDAVSC